MAFPRLSIFDIPLLMDEVTKSFSKHDLYCCIMVSKCWHDWFAPTLWRHSTFSKPISPDEFSRLVYYQEHVWSIQGLQLGSGLTLLERNEGSVRAAKKQKVTGSVIVLIQQNLFSFSHLKTLHLILGQEYTPTVDTIALQLAVSSLHLSFLKLDISIYQVHDVLVQSLKSMAQLRRLDLSGGYISTNFLQDIAEACSNIDSVRLNFKCAYKKEISHNEEHYTGSPSFRQFSDRLQETKIRELSIHFSLAVDEIIVLIPLLRKCPLLEKLKLERVRLPNTISHIALVFEEGRCPWLKHLEVGKISNKIQVRQYISRMLLAIGRGTRGYGATGEDGTSQNTEIDNDLGGHMTRVSNDAINEISDYSMLETLILDKSVPIGQIPLASITQRHAVILTHLVVPKIHLSVLGVLMSDLYRVRYFSAKIWLENRVSYGVDLDPIFHKKWNSLSLKHLDLNVDGLTCNIKSIMDPAWNGSLADRCTSYLLMQIARLGELEELRLKCELNLLTREVGPGYLTRLATLKRLKVLRLDRETVPSLMTDAYLGEEEAEWMHECWPRLRKIVYKKPVFPTNIDGVNSVYGNGIVDDERRNRNVDDLFVTTFLERRPWLEIKEQEQ